MAIQLIQLLILAKDLITKLLTVDPEERATIDEAMEHPWMNINVSTSCMQQIN